MVASGSYLLGEQTLGFEREFSDWIDPTRTVHVTAVSSGGAALQLALRALGVGPGDEVIVPAFTAVPTASAVCAVGATPVPVDVESDTANLDPLRLGDATTSRTRAVIVVHLFGRPATIPHTELAIVNDAAQAHGAIGDHTQVAATAYSFYPTKNLGGIGDGGAVATNDSKLDDTIRRLRVHGMTDLYVHEDISQNFRMSEIEAAWLRHGLTRLTDDNRRRQRIARHYRECAPDLFWQADHEDHVFHLCVFRSSVRDDVRRSLAASGVATAVHYPLSLHNQPAYRTFARAACTNAAQWAQECVTVPCFPEMTDGEVELVGSALAALAVVAR